MNELDIASFAESLLTEEVAKGKPVQFAAAQAPNAPDVSDIEVPADFASQILTEGNWEKANVVVERPAIQPSRKPVKPSVATPQLSEEVKIRKDLFEQYREKLGELDKIVQEMTTVGMIGVGAGTSSNPTTLSVTKKRLKKKRKNVNR